MIRKERKIAYDRESEVLSIEVSRAKSVDSDVKGNVVIDYDKKGEIVRVNFYSFDFAGFRSNFKALKEAVHGSRGAVLVK